MRLLSHDRYCAELLAQTDQLRLRVADADLTAPVPTCPGWDLGRLLRHLGGAHRWIETTVRTHGARLLVEEDAAGADGPETTEAAVLGEWLARCAARLVDSLLVAGPDAAVWITPGQPEMSLVRRALHDTVLHRADVELALGTAFEVDPEIALDALDEWLELASQPRLMDAESALPELLGPDRTLRLQATGSGPDAASWLVDLTGDTPAWHRETLPPSGAPAASGPYGAGTEPEAAVTVRGPLTGLLLLVYGRRSIEQGGFELDGDGKLFDSWLERAGFWQRA